MPWARLVEFIESHPRSPTFQLWVSAIPLYCSIGLAEGNEMELGTELGTESPHVLRVIGEEIQ